MLPKTAVQLPFSGPDTTVAAATQSILDDTSPVTGLLKSITLHFPDGCNALVEITIYLQNMRVLPLNNKIALNNTTVTFEVNRPIKKSDKLRAVIANKDSVNSHTPSIIFNIEGLANG